MASEVVQRIFGKRPKRVVCWLGGWGWSKGAVKSSRGTPIPIPTYSYTYELIHVHYTTLL